MVAGTRPAVSRQQVEQYLLQHFQLDAEDAEVRLYRPDDFLIVFRRRIDADRVLHAEPPASAAFQLSFMRWRREARAVAAPLQYKVILDMRGIPAHLWEVDIAQRIVGSSCLIIQAAPDVSSKRNMRTFTVAAWAVDPDLVPTEVVLVVPEKEAPFVQDTKFYLRPEELIHSSKATLRYRVSTEVREVQDWRQPSDSSSEDNWGYGGGASDDDDSDPGHDFGSGRGGSSRPWPRRHRFPPGGGGTAPAWPTSRGCDSAIGWWGHSFATGRESVRRCQRRRPVRAPAPASHRANIQGPPPRQSRRSWAPRRVWVVRSKSRHAEVVGSEKRSGKDKAKARCICQAAKCAPKQLMVASASDDLRATSPVSASEAPDADNVDGTNGPRPASQGPQAHGGGLVAMDPLCDRSEVEVAPNRWDPMRHEGIASRRYAKAGTDVPAGKIFGRILGAFGPRRESGPLLEAITFPEVPAASLDGPAGIPILLGASSTPPRPTPEFSFGSPLQVRKEGEPCTGMPIIISPSSTRNVTTTRGAPPMGGSEPLSAAEFADLCTTPLPEPVMLLPPQQRKARQRSEQTLLPRRSTRIAKNSRGRVSNPLVAAQNVLMRKLGIIKEEAEPDADAVQQYSELCCKGLSVSDAEAIDELFPEHIPVDDEADDDEELLEHQ
ncbi:unnamed protein product [Urochloa decumbens]|uniref:Uncharacterized protein n=1 Tax=Urochloa decumbens TaxID=240449 RepID=A0ABC8VJB6_9POAL